MTLILNLPPGTEATLAREAARQATTPEALALEGLRILFPAEPEQDAAAPDTLERLLAQFQAEDPRAALDSGRDAYRASAVDAAIADKHRKQGLRLS